MKLRLGTRRSALALAQSRWVAERLARAAGVEVELVPITTRGDRTPGDLAAAGGKGLFTAELEAGLLAGDLDLAVHSLKDLPVALPAGLILAAFPERADPRDALVSAAASSLEALPAGAVLLTGSLRRRAQLLALRPDLEVRPVRGNVDTRLAKRRRLEEEERLPGGAILAVAGLARLGVTGEPVHPLDPAVILPAPGQGTLALEVRAGSPAEEACRALDHPPTARAAAAERAVVAAFGGDCTLPLAAWAREEPAAGSDGGHGGEATVRLRLTALLANPDGRRIARGEAVGATPGAAAAACVAALRGNGADAVLAAIRGGGA
jgi:hydroxymethylbilane synthase